MVVPCRDISPLQDRRVYDPLLPSAAPWSPASGCRLPPGAEQANRPVRGSTIAPRQRSRGAAWWRGPGPALPRGPSQDGLKTDSTGDGLKTNTVDLRASRIPRQGRHPRSSVVPRHHRGRAHDVLACGPVRPERPGYRSVVIGRERCVAHPLRVDRSAGRHDGAIRPGYPPLGAYPAEGGTRQAGRATGAAASIALSAP